MITDELKPCPFCGGKPRAEPESNAVGSYWFICDNVSDGCGCEGPYRSTVDEAFEAWNRRADLSILASAGEVKAPDIADDNDGKEQDAFEEWAKTQRYDMHQHPLHWLFLDERTAAARDGWRAGIRYARDRIRSATPISAGEVKVKPLKWEYREQAMMIYVVRRHWGIEYHINQSFGSDSYYFTTVKHDGTILYAGDDLPSAQAAAQKDHEAEICSALHPSAPVTEVASEPVEWLSKNVCGHSIVSPTAKDAFPVYAAPPLETRPVAFEVLDHVHGTYITRSEQAALATEFPYNGLYRRIGALT